MAEVGLNVYLFKGKYIGKKRIVRNSILEKSNDISTPKRQNIEVRIQFGIFFAGKNLVCKHFYANKHYKLLANIYSTCSWVLMRNVRANRHFCSEGLYILSLILLIWKYLQTTWSLYRLFLAKLIKIISKVKQITVWRRQIELWAKRHRS